MTTGEFRDYQTAIDCLNARMIVVAIARGRTVVKRIVGRNFEGKRVIVAETQTGNIPVEMIDKFRSFETARDAQRFLSGDR
ncbi:MAG TPA: hypothetical protein PLX39_15405 [Pyrinomonadaceae bacterium]|nr:hypothetical protein [Pyrinomonadaceae bacterium]